MAKKKREPELPEPSDEDIPVEVAPVVATVVPPTATTEPKSVMLGQAQIQIGTPVYLEVPRDGTGQAKFFVVDESPPEMDGKVLEIKAYGRAPDYSKVQVTVHIDAPVDKTVTMEFEVGQPVGFGEVRSDKIAPELLAWFDHTGLPYQLDPGGGEKVSKIIGIQLGTGPVKREKEELAKWRRKISACSELLDTVFLFPDRDVATLYTSAWFADGAKMILKGVPGAGKTTLIEASTMLMVADFDRWKDAQLYYKNNWLSPKSEEDCSCGSGKPYKDCCVKTGYNKYTIDDKPIGSFGAREYLSMYRKSWGRCPRCGCPSGERDVVTTTPTDTKSKRTGLYFWMKCNNEMCPGRKDKFTATYEDTTTKDRLDEPILAIRDDTKVSKVEKVFPSRAEAETYMAEVSKDESVKDYFFVDEVTTGWAVKRCSYSSGYIFKVPHFEPLLGVAKITPKKRPEEIFYYTEIEKEVVEVSDEGDVKSRERFVMPPVARPIVKANVKFFNEANRCRPEVQDEILGLLEEGEVEYKGQSFYTNSPFIAFFDLNPHKEETEKVLDWAFYDRLDMELILPTIDFGSKLELLTTGINVRQEVFKEIMSDFCKNCGTFVNKGELVCPECKLCPVCRGHIRKAIKRTDKEVTFKCLDIAEDGSTCGAEYTYALGEIVPGVEPIFIDELDAIRKHINEAVVVSEEAKFVLAILSDMYGRCYLKYTDDAAMPKLQREALGLKAEDVGGFVDISTCQWWDVFKKTGPIKEDTSGTGTGTSSSTRGVEKLFKQTTPKGLERPLGLRVCYSVLKMARARAWFLTMADTLKVGPRSRDYDFTKRLPDIMMEETDKLEVERRKTEMRLDMEAHHKDARDIRKELASIKKSVWYRLLECPTCGEPCAKSNPGNVLYGCPKCKTPFYPVFQVVVKPEDIVAVFPYCASMRFCADYHGNYIPDEVTKRYPNVTEWLKDEIGQMTQEDDFRKMLKGCIEAFHNASAFCSDPARSPKDRKDKAVDAMHLAGYKLKAQDYPFYWQSVAYMGRACGEGGFSDRWPSDDKNVKTIERPGGAESVEEFGVSGEKVKLKRRAWDDKPSEELEKK